MKHLNLWAISMVITLFLLGSNASAQDTYINTNTTISTSTSLSGNIYVSNGATLTINNNAIVYMPSNGKIYLQTTNGIGSTLIMSNGAKITSYTSWGGIEIHGTYSQSQLAVGGVQRQSRLIMTDATLERMFLGIYNYNPGAAPLTSAGGFVQATNSHFLNNRTTLYFNKYRNKSPFNSNSFWNDLTFFNRCTFEFDANYPFGNGGGVALLQDVEGISFLGCSFINSSSTSKKGLVTYRSGFRINEGCTGLSLPCASGNIVRSSFTGFNMAIEGYGLVDFHKIYIRNTDFSENRYAINLYSYAQPEIIGSTFEYTRVASVPSAQIALSSCPLAKVEENTIELFNNWTLNTPDYGILINNSGQHYNELYKNEIRNMGYHIQALNLNRQTTPPFSGLNLICNDNSTGYTNGFDITVDKESSYSPSYYGINANIYSTQGGNVYASNNLFDSKSLFPGFLNHFMNLGQNLLYNYGSNSNEEPIYYSSNSIILNQLEGTECYSRDLYYSLTDATNALNTILSDLQNLYNEGAYDDQHPDFGLFLAIYADYQMLYNNVISLTYEDTSYNPKKMVSLLGQGIGNHADNWLAALVCQSDLALLASTDSIFGAINYSNLTADDETEKNLLEEYIAIYNQYAEADYAGYDGLEEAVLNLMGQGMWWSQDIGKYYLAAHYDYSFEPVYVEYDLPEQRLASTRFEATVNKLENVRVFPNPVVDILTLEIPDGEYSIVLSDVLGKKVNEESVVKGGTHQIDMSDLQNGVYLIQILDKVNGKAFKQKIIK